MNLFITEDKQRQELIDDSFHLSPDRLQYKAVHMFIASNMWDTISIQLSDKVSEEYTKYFPLVSDTILTTIKHKPTDHDLRCLCNLYPEKSGELRYAFMCGTNLNEVVPNVTISNC